MDKREKSKELYLKSGADKAIRILSDITGYSVDELMERNTEPLLQPEDCLKAMLLFSKNDNQQFD